MRKPDICEHCGSVTVYVSWSSLKTWETCRQKGTLHQQGLKAKVSDVRNFFPGRVTDRVVRGWLQDDPRNNLGAMPSMVDAVIERELGEVDKKKERVSWRDGTDKAAVRKDCIDAVKKIEPALVKYVLPYEWQVDFGFKTPVLMQAPWGMERVVINGYMDIIVRDPVTGTWRIYDVKHTLNKDYWRGSFGQLVFYSYENLIRTGKIPLEVGFLQPLVGEAVKRFNVTEAHINNLAGRIQSMAWEVWTGSTAPRVGHSECFYCDVKHACVKYKPVEAPNGRSTIKLL